AMLFSQIVTYGSFAKLWDQACGGCLQGTALSTALTVNYWLAAACGIVVAPLIAGIVYIVLVRRFAGAPPLVATVLTIAIASLLTYLASPSGPIPSLFNPNLNPNQQQQVVSANLAPPT